MLFIFNVSSNIVMFKNGPSHDKNFDTHADDYNSQYDKTCRQSIVGELHLTNLIKL